MTVLETERLILRPLRRSDLATLAAVLNNQNISRKLTRVPFPYSLRDAEEFFAITQSHGPRTLNRAITLRHGNNSVCGGIAYEQQADEDCAELGYWLAEPEWGKGYGGEAARAVTAHAFEVAEYPRLVSGYHLGNDASRRILERLGFHNSGVVPTYSKGAGAIEQIMRMELTRDAWQSRAPDL